MNHALTLPLEKEQKDSDDEVAMTLPWAEQKLDSSLMVEGVAQRRMPFS